MQIIQICFTRYVSSTLFGLADSTVTESHLVIFHSIFMTAQTYLDEVAGVNLQALPTRLALPTVTCSVHHCAAANAPGMPTSQNEHGRSVAPMIHDKALNIASQVVPHAQCPRKLSCQACGEAQLRKAVKASGVIVLIKTADAVHKLWCLMLVSIVSKKLQLVQPILCPGSLLSTYTACHLTLR